jgi:hypothetical protein
MIFARCGIPIDAYPSIRAYLEPFRKRLEPRPENWDAKAHGAWPGRAPGRHAWYELQSTVNYWPLFEQPKILYQEIQFHPQYALSDSPIYGNNKVFLLPTADLYLLAVLNSPLMWWHNWRYLPHMKDEALNPAGFRMETLPIAEPTPALRTEVEDRVAALLALTAESRNQQHELLNWLRLEFGVEKPGQQLENFAHLSGDALVAEVRKRRPKTAPRLTPSAITELTHTHAHYAGPAQHREVERRQLEQRLSNLVNQAYRLTEAEIELLWRTAPPRMPGGQG